MKHLVPILVILLLISPSFLSVGSTNINVSKRTSSTISDYTTHDPIFINGNNDFTFENGVSGGSGTSTDPYIIEGWEIIASSQHGIHIENVNIHFIIRDCYIHNGSPNKNGIVFKTVSNGTIEYNYIIENSNGILFKPISGIEFSCDYNKIHHNDINDNTNNGIYFEHNPSDHHSYNIIYHNIISGNNQGIFLITSSHNLVFSNNILSNEATGVNLTMCLCGGTSNKVYHNNFIKNGDEERQAVVVQTLHNDWDDGYPSGGNFWSDYNGTDNYSGPNQNIYGSDSIGDTPYKITTYNTYQNDYDFYPLIEPWGGNIPPFAEFFWLPTVVDSGDMIFFNASESYDYDGNITLYEWDWDNDGEYDENHTNPNATYTFEEVGYYPVTLQVHENNFIKDTKTKTVRVGNYPPCEPKTPIPPNGSANVSTIVQLGWTGGDPDGDEVTYIIYFGNTSPPPKYISNQSTNFTLVDFLDFNTSYYWKIISTDKYGDSAEGPIWNFKVRMNNPPKTPIINGPKIFKVGESGEYTYNISSIDPDNDEINYGIDWGDNDTEWMGFYKSGEEVLLNVTIGAEKKGNYKIFRIKAADTYGVESDWATLEITVPKSYNFFICWLERFPLLQRLFERLFL